MRHLRQVAVLALAVTASFAPPAGAAAGNDAKALNAFQITRVGNTNHFFVAADFELWIADVASHQLGATLKHIRNGQVVATATLPPGLTTQGLLICAGCEGDVCTKACFMTMCSQGACFDVEGRCSGQGPCPEGSDVDWHCTCMLRRPVTGVFDIQIGDALELHTALNSDIDLANDVATLVVNTLP